MNIVHNSTCSRRARTGTSPFSGLHNIVGLVKPKQQQRNDSQQHNATNTTSNYCLCLLSEVCSGGRQAHRGRHPRGELTNKTMIAPRTSHTTKARSTNNQHESNTASISILNTIYNRHLGLINPSH